VTKGKNKEGKGEKIRQGMYMVHRLNNILKVRIFFPTIMNSHPHKKTMYLFEI
jgi:hypothetical protein